MNIRNAAPGDVVSICDLVSQAVVQKGSLEDTGLYVFRSMGPADMLPKIYDAGASRYFYVAEIDDLVVGFLEAIPGALLQREDILQRNPNQLHKKIPGHANAYAFVNLVVVDRAHRRQGIARQLYQHLFSEAQGRYQYAVATISHAPFRNRGSITLHRSLGFYAVKEASVQFSWQEHPITVGVYQKWLNSRAKE